MEMQGVVVGWKDGVARVEISTGACFDCKQGCPARLEARPGLLEVEAAEPLQPGQSVRVDVSLPSPARAVTMAYVFPLLGFMSGLFLGNSVWAGAPLPSLGTALAGAGLSYAVIAVLERKRRSRITAHCVR